MESGTEERWVRCRRCHGVFQAGLPNCTRCGTPYMALKEAPGEAGSFADRYHGTEFAEPQDPPPPPPPSRRTGIGLLVGVGIAMVVTALALGSLAAGGAFNGPTPPTSPPMVIAHTPTPTPVPTLPPMITATLDALNDPFLNVHVSIKTSLSLNARVNGRSSSAIVNTDVDCANGNESGKTTTGNVSTEWRLVDGIYYSRALPTGKWSAKVGIVPFVVLSPLFMLRESRMLQYVGPDQWNGQAVEKLVSTDWWNPDVGKVSGLDIAALNIKPQQRLLTLWVASDGTPVYATFRAWTDAQDGTNLLDISSTYTFTQPGLVSPIPSPTGMK